MFLRFKLMIKIINQFSLCSCAQVDFQSIVFPHRSCCPFAAIFTFVLFYPSLDYFAIFRKSERARLSNRIGSCSQNRDAHSLYRLPLLQILSIVWAYNWKCVHKNGLLSLAVLILFYYFHCCDIQITPNYTAVTIDSGISDIFIVFILTLYVHHQIVLFAIFPFIFS